MKTIKRLSAALAMLMCILMVMPVFAVGKEQPVAPESFELSNIFAANYGENDADVSAVYETHANVAMFGPVVYTVSENGELFVVDKWYTGAPIKVFGADNAYVRTISTEQVVNENESILELVSYGTDLYALTTGGELAVIKADDSVTKYEIPEVEGLELNKFYGASVIGNEIVLVFVQRIAEPAHYQPFFLTFKTETNEFDATQTLAAVTYALTEGTEDEYTATIKYGEMNVATEANICDVPLGLASNGNLVVGHHTEEAVTYAEYDATGALVDSYTLTSEEASMELRTPRHFVQGNLTSALTSEEYYTVNKNSFETEAEVEWFKVELASTEDAVESKLTAYVEELSFDRAPSAGPDNFAVAENGDVFVLETRENLRQIKHFTNEGVYVETITAQALSTELVNGIANFCIKGDKLYITAVESIDAATHLYEYDIAAKTVTQYEIPTLTSEQMTNAMYLIVMDNYIVFDSKMYDMPLWIFDTETNAFTTDANVYSRSYDAATHMATIKVAGVEYKISAKEGTTVYPIGLSAVAEGARQLIVEYTDENGTSYRVYAEGEEVAFAEESYRDLACDIACNISVTNGKIYRAKTTTTQYSIDEIVFNGEYFTMKFDLNFDQKENTGDAVLLLRYCAELESFDAALTVKADVNGDCLTNTGDAITVLRNCVGLA